MRTCSVCNQVISHAVRSRIQHWLVVELTAGAGYSHRGTSVGQCLTLAGPHGLAIQVQDAILFVQVLALGPAPLPAILPVAHEELEAEWIHLHAWLKADAEVLIVHFVLVGVHVKKTDVAGDGKEDVIVERRQLGELIFHHLRRIFSTSTCSSDDGLS